MRYSLSRTAGCATALLLVSALTACNSFERLHKDAGEAAKTELGKEHRDAIMCLNELVLSDAPDSWSEARDGVATCADATTLEYTDSEMSSGKYARLNAGVWLRALDFDAARSASSIELVDVAYVYMAEGHEAVSRTAAQCWSTLLDYKSHEVLDTKRTTCDNGLLDGGTIGKDPYVPDSLLEAEPESWHGPMLSPNRPPVNTL